MPWSPYKTRFWCRQCLKYIPRKEIKTNPPRCPKCGFQLRTKPRAKKGKQKIYYAKGCGLNE